MDSSSSRASHFIGLAVRAILTMAALLFVGAALVRGAGQLSADVLVESWPSLMAAFAIAVFWYCGLELASEWVLRRVCIPGCELPWPVTARAYFVSMLARYVPGKVWFVMARTALLNRAGVRTGDVIRCIIYEQGHFAAGSAVVGLALLPIGLAMLASLNRWVVALGVIGTCCAALLWLARPHAIFAVLNRLGRGLGVAKPAFRMAGTITEWRVAFIIFAALAALQGAIVLPLVGPFAARPIQGVLAWCFVMFAYPLARLFGQIAIVPPAGIGAREGAFVLLAGPILGVGPAAVIAAIVRVLTILAELAITFLVLLLLRLGLGEPGRATLPRVEDCGR